MNHLLEFGEKIALETDTLIDIAKPEKSHWVLYNKISSKYKSLREMIGKDDGVFILYTTPGHYAVLFQNYYDKNTINYFGSYGFSPEKSIELTKNNDTLLKYIHNFESNGGEVKVNTHRFQKMSKSAETCGRHVPIRLFFRALTNREYIHFINSSKYNADFTVTLMTILYPRSNTAKQIADATGLHRHLKRSRIANSGKIIYHP